jgi:hypothetical protein
MEMAWRPWLLWQATCVLTAAVAVPDRGHKAGALVCLWVALCDSRSVCVLCSSVVPLLAARVLHCKCVPRCRCLGMCPGMRGAQGVYGAVLHGCRVLQQPDAHRHSLLLLCSALHCGCQEQSLWPSGLGVTLLLLSGLRPGFGACLCGGSCNCLMDVLCGRPWHRAVWHPLPRWLYLTHTVVGGSGPCMCSAHTSVMVCGCLHADWGTPSRLVVERGDAILINVGAVVPGVASAGTKGGWYGIGRLGAL